MPVITEEYLMKTMYNKSLYKFLRDFWNTCDSQRFKGSVLTEYMCECFMYSVRQFLPDDVKEDWVSVEEIDKIINRIKEYGVVYSANYPYKDEKVIGVFDKNTIGEDCEDVRRFVQGELDGALDGVRYNFMEEWLTDDEVYGPQPKGFERKSVIKKLTADDVAEFKIVNFFDEASGLNQHNLNLPPSHCKSKTLNVMSGAWLFSMVGIKLVSLSHTGSLATDFNSQRQRVIRSDLWKRVFPDLKIIKDTSDSLMGNHFGELFSQPFLHMTGKHMDIAVLDDLVDAHNTIKIGENLNNALAFMQHTLPSRKNDPSKSVLWNVMQRLAPSDVTGWIEQNQSRLWSKTVMPARAREREIYIFPVSGRVWVRDVRQECELVLDDLGQVISYGAVGVGFKSSSAGVDGVGDYLWPEQFGDYVGMEQSVGESVFNTQYQQDPAGTDKTIIKKEHIQYADVEELEYFSQTYASHDLPFKGGDTNDLHGSIVAFSRGNKLYIDDMDESHRDYADQKIWIEAIANAYPGVLQIVEDKANGPAVISDLQNLLSGTLIPFNPGMDDKIKRTEMAKVYMKDVYFLRHGGMVRSNCQKLITRLLEFPFVKYKDIVDAFTMLILYFFVDVQYSVFYKSLSDSNLIQVENLQRDSNHKYIVTKIDGSIVRYNTIDGAVLKYGDIWKMIKVAITYTGGIFTVVDSKTIRADTQEATEIMKEFFKGTRLIYDPVGNLSGFLKLAKLQPCPETDQDEFIVLIQSGLAKGNLRFLNTQSEVLADLKQVRWNKDLMSKGEKIVDYSSNYSLLITGIVSSNRGKMPF